MTVSKPIPSSLIVHFRMGFCDYRLGNLKEALAFLKTIQIHLKDTPLLLYTRFLLGEIWLTLGDPASSNKELTHVVQTPDPHSLWGPSLLLMYLEPFHF